MARVKKEIKENVTTTAAVNTPFEDMVQPPEVPLVTSPPAISISELQSMVQIINTATSRGAFRGNELTIVGGLYDKLTQFLKYVIEGQKNQSNEEKQ